MKDFYNYSIGIKLKNEKTLSVIYLCDFIENKVNIINCFQIEEIRTTKLSNVSSFCDLYFYINKNLFIQINIDYNKCISWDISLKGFLIKYDLQEWLI